MRELLTFRRPIEFAKYLIQGKEVFEEKLPDKLNLSRFTPFMDKLYEEIELGYVIADPEKRKFEIEYARQGKNSKVNPKSNEEMQAFIQWVERKDIGERSSTVYYDKEDARIKMWKINHGSVNESKAEYPPNDERFVPLMEIHTHPSDGFFSLIDLQRLQYRENGRRKAMAAIVLCPDIQFMVVSTSTTRAVGLPELTTFHDDYVYDNIDEKNLDYQRRLNHYMTQLGNISAKVRSKLDDDIFNYWENLWRRKALGEITEEEVRSLGNAEETRKADVFEEKVKRLNEIFLKLEEKVEAKKARNQNEILVETARSINLKVYSSTDRTHFTKMDDFPEL